MSRYNKYGGWPKYVSVAERRKEATTMVAKLKKKGQDVHPVVIEGRAIAKTFWGKSWCKNLTSYSDFENRLPRGRTYVRNGSVIDLIVTAGEVRALVTGSSIYKVIITMTAVSVSKWHSIVDKCAGRIDSLIELLQGKFSKSVMEIITDGTMGLFPNPCEMNMSCNCPDSAGMCKHIAAVLYGIGARLDEQPEKLFVLRSADHMDLISKAGVIPLPQTARGKKTKGLTEDLSSLFGIDIEAKPSINHTISKNINKK